MEVNDQQFYELDASGRPVAEQPAAPDPGPRKDTSWLRYAIVFLILIVVALLIVWFLRFMLGQDGPVEMTQDEYNAVYAEIEEDLLACEGEDDVQRCKDRVWTKKARELQDVNVCLQASESFAEDCVSGIAFDLLDDDLCELLEGEVFESCWDSVIYQRVINDSYYPGCEVFFDRSLTSRCQLAVSSDIAQEGGCAEGGVDPVLCDDEIWLQQAVDSGNYTACNWLATQTGIENCREMFGIIDNDGDGLTLYDEYFAQTSDASADTDGDGLSDFEEVEEYGTDPTSVDSDEDGYSDGEEVASGFNPLGE